MRRELSLATWQALASDDRRRIAQQIVADPLAQEALLASPQWADILMRGAAIEPLTPADLPARAVGDVALGSEDWLPLGVALRCATFAPADAREAQRRFRHLLRRAAQSRPHPRAGFATRHRQEQECERFARRLTEVIRHRERLPGLRTLIRHTIGDLVHAMPVRLAQRNVLVRMVADPAGPPSA